MNEFELTAEIRSAKGSRASRRMRRANTIPAILYGAKKDSLPLSVNAHELKKKLDSESFSSHILSLNVENRKEPAILKAIQRHPVSSQVIHLDFQRISEDQKIQLSVPLHFIDEDVSPTKKMGGVISHSITEVEITCLPKDLPESIAVDMSRMQPGKNLHLSELTPPKGIVLTALAHGVDQTVASASIPRGASETSEMDETTQEEGAGNS
jgi:large subunit ribosomal protein L25